MTSLHLFPDSYARGKDGEGVLDEYFKGQRAAQAALDMAREEEYLSRAYQHKTYEIVQAPAWEQVKIDPRTGEANQDWSAIVIERALKDDVEWAERLGKFYKTQEAHVEARSVVHGAKAKMDALMDQLVSARSQANVLAEWLRFLSD